MNRLAALRLLNIGDSVIGLGSGRWPSAVEGKVVTVTGEGGVLIRLGQHERRRGTEQWFPYNRVQLRARLARAEAPDDGPDFP